MSRLLVRAHKSPFRVVPPRKALESNVFGTNVGNLVFSRAFRDTVGLAQTAHHDLRFWHGHSPQP